MIEPQVIYPDVDYYAFVDELKSDSIWIQKKVYQFSSDNIYANRRNSKIFKILPELFIPGYDYYFWVDSTHEVVMDPHYVVKNIILDSKIALFIHPQRNCVYAEARELIKLKYDHKDLIKEQMKYYRKMNYPINNGLYELPCSIRKNCEDITKLNLMWWELICKYSSRDQLSLPFVLHKLGIKPLILTGFANNGFWANDIMPQVRNKFY